MRIITNQDMLSEGEGESGPGSIGSFAMTFPQLVAQAMSLGMDEPALGLLRRGYDLAEQIFDGMYRGQGTPFVNHLVRTGSIVMAQGQPMEVVIAGMLHGVYLLDRFEGSRRRKPQSADRAYLQREIGQNVEALVWGYAHLGWHNREVIEAHLANFDSYGTDKQSMLVIQLANELEDYLDLAMLYVGRFPYCQHIEKYGDLCVEMAVRLGLPTLGQALRTAYDATLSHRLPKVVIRDHKSAYELPRRHFWEKMLFERVVPTVKRGVRKMLRRVGVKR